MVALFPLLQGVLGYLPFAVFAAWCSAMPGHFGPRPRGFGSWLVDGGVVAWVSAALGLLLLNSVLVLGIIRFGCRRRLIRNCLLSRLIPLVAPILTFLPIGLVALAWIVVLATGLSMDTLIVITLAGWLLFPLGTALLALALLIVVAERRKPDPVP